MSTGTNNTGLGGNAAETSRNRPAPRRGGPPLPLPAAAYAALTLASIVTYPGLRPADSAATVLATLHAHQTTATISATLLVASAAPLAVWTASISHRLRSLVPRVAAPHIALVGGVLATGSLAASGLTAWTATRAAGLGDASLVRAMSTLSFGFGGVGFALGSALLLAGVAVPSLILRLMPRWLAVAGLIVAAASALSVPSLLIPELGVLLAITRFGGILFILAASVTLPISRRSIGTKERAR